MASTREEHNLQRVAPFLGAAVLGVMCATAGYGAMCQDRGFQLVSMPQSWLWNAGVAAVSVYGLTKVGDPLSRVALVALALAQAAPAYADVTNNAQSGVVGGLAVLAWAVLLTASGLRGPRSGRTAGLAVLLFVVAFVGVWASRRMASEFSGSTTVLLEQYGC